MVSNFNILFDCLKASISVAFIFLFTCSLLLQVLDPGFYRGIKYCYPLCSNFLSHISLSHISFKDLIILLVLVILNEISFSLAPSMLKYIPKYLQLLHFLITSLFSKFTFVVSGSMHLTSIFGHYALLHPLPNLNLKRNHLLWVGNLFLIFL